MIFFPLGILHFVLKVKILLLLGFEVKLPGNLACLFVQFTSG